MEAFIATYSANAIFLAVIYSFASICSVSYLEQVYKYGFRFILTLQYALMFKVSGFDLLKVTRLFTLQGNLSLA